MVVTHDNLIAPLYREAGVFDGTGVEEHLAQLKYLGAEQTNDGGLINLHGAFIELINPELDKGYAPVSTDAAMWIPSAREDMVAKLVAVQDSLKPVGKASSVLQEVAMAFMPDTPKADPTGSGTEVWRALESLLWRAFESLKAMNALQNAGVLEGKVCLGVAQEALIVLDWLLLNPDRLSDLKVNDIYGKWNMVRRIKESMASDGTKASELDADSEHLAKQLLALGFDVQVGGDLKKLRNIAGSVKWHKMIRHDNPMLNKDALAVRYEIVFSERDSVAHSVPSVWPAYVQIAGEEIQVLATVDDRSPDSTSMALWVWSDFFRQLSRLRPNLVTRYDLWAVTLYLGGSYGSTTEERLSVLR